jgi:hypothetical protein
MEERLQEELRGKSAERVAFNDDIFRKANEAIHDEIEGLIPESSGGLPFICECAEEGCTQVLRIPLPDYERLRSDPRLFLNAPGHENAAQGWAAVVERHEHYVVVEKLGRAGEMAEMLDGGPTVEADA